VHCSFTGNFLPGFADERDSNMLVTAGNKKYFGAKAAFFKI